MAVSTRDMESRSSRSAQYKGLLGRYIDWEKAELLVTNLAATHETKVGGAEGHDRSADVIAPASAFDAPFCAACQ